MALRAYGLSTSDHDTWAAATEYNLLKFVIPTIPNSYCYECTVSGISGSNEPSWPITIGQTVQDGSGETAITWTCRALVAPNPLVVTLDAHAAGGFPHKDIWVKSARESGSDTFNVYGSFDGENYRLIDTISCPTGSVNDKHQTYTNSYPFIGCGVSSDFECEIEIVGGE
jgi:hypothetical protein